MMKLKFNSASTWIGLILINILAVSCGCGETPEEKKLKDLQVKNKQAAKKLSDILKTKLNINLTPEQQKDIEKSINDSINKAKKEATVEGIDEGINTLKKELEDLESMDDTSFQEELKKFKYFINPMGAPELDSVSIDRDTLKQLMTILLEIMQNVKEELELKNKGKKPGAKKPSGDK